MVEIGGFTVSRSVSDPGWRWSEHTKPLVGGEWCEARHHRRRRIRVVGGHAARRHRARVRSRRRLRRPSRPRRLHGRRRAVRPHRVVGDARARGSVRRVPRPRPRDAPLHRHRRVNGDHPEQWRHGLGRPARDAPRSHARRARAVSRARDRYRGRRHARHVRHPRAGSPLRGRDSDGRGSTRDRVRSGVHAGEVALAGSEIRGVAVHEAARIMALAAPGEILVSETTCALVAGTSLEFDDRGEHELKGFPELDVSSPTSTGRASAESADRRRRCRSPRSSPGCFVWPLRTGDERGPARGPPPRRSPARRG